MRDNERVDKVIMQKIIEYCEKTEDINWASAWDDLTKGVPELKAQLEQILAAEATT